MSNDKLNKHSEQTVDVGTVEDVEKLMRKYDKESNTRIWEGTPAVVVRFIMVAFSVYCMYSTLFSVAALEKRMTGFLAMVIIMFVAVLFSALVMKMAGFIITLISEIVANLS